jgi:hypothetical protein
VARRLLKNALLRQLGLRVKNHFIRRVGGGKVTRAMEDQLGEELQELQLKYDKAITALRSCRGAMIYAHGNHADQYYLNVLNKINKTLKELGEIK